MFGYPFKLLAGDASEDGRSVAQPSSGGLRAIQSRNCRSTTGPASGPNTATRTCGSNYLNKGCFLSSTLLHPDGSVNSRFPGCNRNWKRGDAWNPPYRRPRPRLQAPQDRIRHSRRQAKGVRPPGIAIGRQALLRPLPASRRARMEDHWRHCLDGCQRGAIARRDRPRRGPPGGEPATRSCRDPLRGRRRNRVRAPQPGLEGGNAGGEPGLPAKPDTPALRGTADRRHRQPGRRQLVRFAARHPGRRRPVDAGALRHHARGRGNGLPSRRLEPVQGHPALPPRGAGALPVGR